MTFIPERLHSSKPREHLTIELQWDRLSARYCVYISEAAIGMFQKHLIDGGDINNITVLFTMNEIVPPKECKIPEETSCST